MILFDANIWVYLLDATCDQHQVTAAHAEQWFDQPFLIPCTVQLEVMHYLAKRTPAEPQLIEVFLAQEADIEPTTSAVTSEAASILLTHAKHGIGGRDAAVLAVAKRKAATLATNDQALAKVAKTMGIAVVNPAQAPRRSKRPS